MLGSLGNVLFVGLGVVELIGFKFEEFELVLVEFVLVEFAVFELEFVVLEV